MRRDPHPGDPHPDRVQRSPHLPITIWPLTNWAGRFDSGEVMNGCVTVTIPGASGGTFAPYVPAPGEPGYDDDYHEIQHCVEPNWPGKQLWSSLRPKPGSPPRGWVGSLTQHGRDPSGQYYRRNRYYDPVAGRFTQEDPIGIAGGLNLYGYAGGDPINFSDPFGLSAEAADSTGSRWEQVRDFLRERWEESNRDLCPPDGDTCILTGTPPALGPGGGFKSFGALKRYLGGTRELRHWHHIVEQTGANVQRFGGDIVQHARNIRSVPAEVHTRISAFYSSKQPFTGGRTVREWLRNQSFEQQFEFGTRILRDFWR